MAANDPIRVAILTPTLAARVGISTLLGASESIQIAAEAADPAGLEDAWWDIDVLIIQGQRSLEDIEPRLSPEVQFGLLWISDDPQAAQVLRALPLTAWGLLPAEASREEMIAAVVAIQQGLIVAPRARLDGLWADNPPDVSDDLIEQLTPREAEILEQLAQGLANKQVALDLGISEHTVKFHVSSIYAKLGATNRMEAVRMGLQLGIITL